MCIRFRLAGKNVWTIVEIILQFHDIAITLAKFERDLETYIKVGGYFLQACSSREAKRKVDGKDGRGGEERKSLGSVAEFKKNQR